jgi:hypothetical protein
MNKLKSGVAVAAGENLIGGFVSLVVVSVSVGLSVDVVVEFHVSGGFVVVARIVGPDVALGVVAIASLVLAVVQVSVIVLNGPVEFVVSGGL